MRADDKFIRELFGRFGMSRREILRVINEALKPALRDMSNTRARDEVMKNYGNALDKLKMQYRAQEDILNSRVVNPAADTNAPRSRKTPGQRTRDADKSQSSTDKTDR